MEICITHTLFGWSHLNSIDLIIVQIGMDHGVIWSKSTHSCLLPCYTVTYSQCVTHVHWHTSVKCHHEEGGFPVDVQNENKFRAT